MVPASAVIATLLAVTGTPAPAATVPPPATPPPLPAVPAVAPGYRAPQVPTPPAGIVGVTQQPFVGLTLQNAIGMALANNPDLQIARANNRIAAYQIQAAQGAYDVRLSIEPQYLYSSQAPQNAFFAGPNFGPIVQRTAAINGNAQATLPNGQQFNVGLSGNQTYNNTTINTFNPYYPTQFSASFTQPLGRGRNVTEQGHQLQLAIINQQTTRQQALTTVSGTVAQVENAYWDLVSAWRNVAIQEESLRNTIVQQRSNVRLARQGANAPIDVVQSNAQIAVFQEDVYSALQNVAQLQNQLKSLILANANDAIWNANVVPVTPALELPRVPSLPDLVTAALRGRPEVAQAAAALRSAAENLRYAANQTRPQVDLQLGYQSNGFAGTTVPPGPFFQSNAQQLMAINELIAAVNPTLPVSQQIPLLPMQNETVPGYLAGGLDRSIANLLANRFPTYTAGVLVSFPIGDRTARANLGIAQEQQRIALLQEASTIQRVTSDVRNALQSYESALARLAAARTAREASEAVLASERRRFRAGESTTFLVLQRQIEVADNRGRELEAQTDLNKAVVELQRSTGTILTANSVTLP
ncbi:MAG: TolC family protein [Candidatus Eremiobacteraeota bacterium]|nr:TolC family protein [Candidatus Eremiobacteraeota bacterium]